MQEFIICLVEDLGETMEGNARYKKHRWPIVPRNGDRFGIEASMCEVRDCWHYPKDGKAVMVVKMLMYGKLFDRILKDREWKNDLESAIAS